MREKVLLSGDSNTSKSNSIISLAFIYPQQWVHVFDPDDGIAKLLMEYGATPETLPNLKLIPVKKDFKELLANYELSKATLRENDWLCFDMINRFWDLAQNYWSSVKYGKNIIDRLVELAQAGQSTAFSGMDGTADWPFIKRLHNEALMDDAFLFQPFNIMATAGVKNFSPREKLPKKGMASIYANEFGVKPEGEKGNIYRADTQAIVSRTIEGQYKFNLVRDRGRTVDPKQEFDMTGSNFWSVYMAYRGLS